MRKINLPPARDGYIEFQTGTVGGLKKYLETALGGVKKKRKGKIKGRKKQQK